MENGCVKSGDGQKAVYKLATEDDGGQKSDGEMATGKRTLRETTTVIRETAKRGDEQISDREKRRRLERRRRDGNYAQ